VIHTNCQRHQIAQRQIARGIESGIYYFIATQIWSWRNLIAAQISKEF